MTARNLTVDTAVPYLLERGLVSEAAIVESDLQVIDAGRRNQNLKVVRRRGPSYLIKQPGEGEYGSEATIGCEAAFYEHCGLEPRAAEVRDLLPACHGFDSERVLLVLELIEGDPLWGHPAANPEGFSFEAAEPLGTALATFHRVFRQPSARASWMAGLPAGPPWIFFAHRPTPEMLARLSPANAQVLKLMQKDPAMTRGLDRLRSSWSADTLVHNDIKGDNLLVRRSADGTVRVAMLDWELVQIGDAAWDVGNVFRDLLGCWLVTVPLSSDLSPEQMLEGAQMPLAKLHPAARSFWNAYRAGAVLDAETSGDFLLRALGYAAARMAQGAYELSVGMGQASNLAVAALQLAANIFAEPSAASLQLLGIPAPFRRSGDAQPGL
jgi:aminoglycoside phosphotransferase (APT) family kinase protein